MLPLPLMVRDLIADFNAEEVHYAKISFILWTHYV